MRLGPTMRESKHDKMTVKLTTNIWTFSSRETAPYLFLSRERTEENRRSQQELQWGLPVPWPKFFLVVVRTEKQYWRIFLQNVKPFSKYVGIKSSDTSSIGATSFSASKVLASTYAVCPMSVGPWENSRYLEEYEWKVCCKSLFFFPSNVCWKSFYVGWCRYAAALVVLLVKHYGDVATLTRYFSRRQRFCMFRWLHISFNTCLSFTGASHFSGSTFFIPCHVSMAKLP